MSEQLIGNVGVDAGMIMIGDPCYTTQKNHPANRDWLEFCKWYGAQQPEDSPRFGGIPYDMGHEGLGVVLDTGIGDGIYPVYAEIIDDPDWGRRIASVRIEFLPHPYF